MLYKGISLWRKIKFCLGSIFSSINLGLNIFNADDGLLVFLCGFLVTSLFVEFVSLAVQHRNGLQPLLITQSPRLPVVLAGLLHLSATHAHTRTSVFHQLYYRAGMSNIRPEGQNRPGKDSNPGYQNLFPNFKYLFLTTHKSHTDRFLSFTTAVFLCYAEKLRYTLKSFSNTQTSQGLSVKWNFFILTAHLWLKCTVSLTSPSRYAKPL